MHRVFVYTCTCAISVINCKYDMYDMKLTN